MDTSKNKLPKTIIINIRKAKLTFNSFVCIKAYGCFIYVNFSFLNKYKYPNNRTATIIIALTYKPQKNPVKLNFVIINLEVVKAIKLDIAYAIKITLAFPRVLNAYCNGN